MSSNITRYDRAFHGNSGFSSVTLCPDELFQKHPTAIPGSAPASAKNIAQHPAENLSANLGTDRTGRAPRHRIQYACVMPAARSGLAEQHIAKYVHHPTSSARLLGPAWQRHGLARDACLSCAAFNYFISRLTVQYPFVMTEKNRGFDNRPTFRFSYRANSG